MKEVLLQCFLMVGTFSAGEGSTAFQAVFPYLKLGGYFAIAMLITVLCAMIPARKANRLSPVEATRYVG